jgi:hypothetical protein
MLMSGRSIFCYYYYTCPALISGGNLFVLAAAKIQPFIHKKVFAQQLLLPAHTENEKWPNLSSDEAPSITEINHCHAQQQQLMTRGILLCSLLRFRNNCAVKSRNLTKFKAQYSVIVPKMACWVLCPRSRMFLLLFY